MNVNNAVYEITKIISDWKDAEELKRRVVKVQLSSIYGKFGGK